MKTEFNIWLFQALLTFISTFLIIHLSLKRSKTNRVKYFFYFSFFILLNYILFWLNFTTIWYIIFSFIWLFLNPIYRVSEHVYDLALMDNIKTNDSDFYPAMVLREIILYAWRLLSIILIFLLLKYWLNTEETLKISLIICWFIFLIKYFSIYFWEKYENK